MAEILFIEVNASEHFGSVKFELYCFECNLQIAAKSEARASAKKNNTQTVLVGGLLKNR